jgi:hypothetical protein
LSGIAAISFSFSLRGLSDLGVFAVSNGFKRIHGVDDKNAEVAQRISNHDANGFA